jgi:transposase-like protein
MNRFSEEFKQQLIRKSLLPNSPCLAFLSKDHGIPLTTVYSWKRKYAKSGDMKEDKWIP